MQSFFYADGVGVPLERLQVGQYKVCMTFESTVAQYTDCLIKLSLTTSSYLCHQLLRIRNQCAKDWARTGLPLWQQDLPAPFRNYKNR